MDTNVFIQAKNGPYAFDIVPGYWEFLESKFSTGEIFSSWMVYEELADGNDELSDWVRKRRNKGYFIEPDKEVQVILKLIANYVDQKYSISESQHFLSCADPWVIALAKKENAIVVTHEILVADNSKKIKIPNICKEFKVNYMDTYKMLRELNARFE